MVSRSHSGTIDGWKEVSRPSLMASFNSDQVQGKSSRQFLLEIEGKQIPMVRYNGSSGGSKSDGETNYNVVKTRTEKIVEHTSTVPAAPLITIHRLPPQDHDQHSNSRDLGDVDEDHRHRRRHPAGPDSDVNHQDHHNNYPDEKFEEFINRVRDEAQRRGTTTTTTNNPEAVALPLTSGWRRSVVPPNPRNNNYIQENNITNTTKYEGPNNNNNNAGSGHSLSKPTNQVSTAMEYLKEAMKPFNGKEKEIIGFINNSSAYKDSRPAAPVAKSSPGDPYSHQVVTAAPGKKKGPPAPEKIDSMEATKRYGKLLSRTMDEEEHEYPEIITSREAQKKYNGVFVPRNPPGSRIN